MHSLICWIRLLSLLLVGVALASSPAQAARPAARPNVLVILADDLGYGDLSSYGAEALQSPSIDALVAAGMRFDNFYANCPVCSPTRAALLTGCYPELVGVPGVIRTHADNSWGYLSPDAMLLPELLKSAGYHTAIIGKWHLGLSEPNRPLDRGFDRFEGYLGDMMDDYYTHRRHDINYMRRGRKEIDPKGHATDLFTRWAQDYLDERVKTEQPFFLYLAYNAPHTPIQPPDDWLSRVEAREPGINKQQAKLTALIEHMDHCVGQVIETLKVNGQYANTLIVFTSDNGGRADLGSRNGPLRGSKGEVYEGGIRVPMCAVWPGHIEAGSRSKQRGLTMDLFPTICEAADATINDAIDGRSLLPTLRGELQGELRTDWFWTRREGGNAFLGQEIWAVRRGDWKLLQNRPDEPFQLFNLADDPQEQHDLAQHERRAFDELAGALRRHLQRGGAVRWQP